MTVRYRRVNNLFQYSNYRNLKIDFALEGFRNFFLMGTKRGAEVKMEVKLEGMRGLDEPLEEKPRGKGERIDTRRINVKNPRKPDSIIRSLDGKYLRPRPLIGDKNTKEKRDKSIKDWDARKIHQLIKEEVLRKEDRELDPKELIQPDYAEDKNEYQDYLAEKKIDKDFKEYSAEKEREAATKRIEVNPYPHSLPKELKDELKEARKQDNFGRKNIIRNSRVTRILK